MSILGVGFSGPHSFAGQHNHQGFFANAKRQLMAVAVIRSWLRNLRQTLFFTGYRMCYRNRVCTT